MKQGVSIQAQANEVTQAEWLVLQISNLDIGADARNRVLSLVQSLAGQRIYFPRCILTKPVSIAVARALLEAKAPRVQIRDRLVAGGYCGSNTAAYRIISQALHSRRPAIAES